MFAVEAVKLRVVRCAVLRPYHHTSPLPSASPKNSFRGRQRFRTWRIFAALFVRRFARAYLPRVPTEVPTCTSSLLPIQTSKVRVIHDPEKFHCLWNFSRRRDCFAHRSALNNRHPEFGRKTHAKIPCRCPENFPCIFSVQEYANSQRILARDAFAEKNASDRANPRRQPFRPCGYRRIQLSRRCDDPGRNL